MNQLIVKEYKLTCFQLLKYFKWLFYFLMGEIIGCVRALKY